MPSVKGILEIKRLPVFRPSAIVAAICACVVLLSLGSNAAPRELPRDALWIVVHNLCVPGQTQLHDPRPCLQVDLRNGIENGFAILRDPRGGAQFLLVPTTRIPGIESPIVRDPSGLNYFASAWESRHLIDEALHLTLTRDAVGLAINSVESRSQDQLHIHFSCVRTDVWETLHKNEGKIGDHWTQFNMPLYQRVYIAMWVPGEHLSGHNPFTLLAQGLPGAIQDMGDRTLVVTGFTRSNGTKGFVLLTDRADKQTGDLADGEDLLDHSCHIAALGKTS